MGQFKDLLLSIQERLATVPELKYIDKDWGQLRYEQPAVKYPCALIDLEQAGFSETGKGGQLADVSVTITIADQRLTPTSLYAPRKEDGYAAIELMESVHDALQLYYEKGFAPLVRTNWRKLHVSNTFEVYALSYATQFTAGHAGEGTAVHPEGIKIPLYPGSK